MNVTDACSQRLEMAGLRYCEFSLTAERVRTAAHLSMAIQSPRTTDLSAMLDDASMVLSWTAPRSKFSLSVRHVAEARRYRFLSIDYPFCHLCDSSALSALSVVKMRLCF
jgi:hypothetical protein